MAVENPFWGYEAEDFSPEEAVERFVPNRIWDEVRNPDNQLLLGGIGTGKSIVLKRLSFPAMHRAAVVSKYARSAAFLSKREFLGVYVDVRELAFLNGLSDTTETNYYLRNSLPSSEEQLVISDYAASLVLAKETLRDLLRIDPSSRPREEAISQDFHNLIEIPGESPKSLSKLYNMFSYELLKLRQCLTDGDMKNYLPGGERAPLSILNTAQTISEIVREHLAPTGWKIVFLVDQYDQLPMPARKIVSSMLLRSNRGYFRTIVAARPYALTLETPSRRIVPKEDFFVRLVEYLPDEQNRYVDLLREIFSKLLEKSELSHLSPKTLLPTAPNLAENKLKIAARDLGIQEDNRNILNKYIGFDNIASISSGSVRSFLSICRECVAALPSLDRLVKGGVPPETQLAGLAHTARDELDRLSSIPEYPFGEITKVAKMIIDKSKNRSPEEQCSPREIIIHDMNSEETTPHKRAQRLLTYGFQEGAFQYCQPHDVGLRLPIRFRLSSMLIPLMGIDHKTKGILDISIYDIYLNQRIIHQKRKALTAKRN